MQKRLTVFCFLFFILFSHSILSQTNSNSSSIFEVTRKFSDSNNFLVAYNAISEFPSKNPQEKWQKMQMQITYASFLAHHPDYAELLKKFERPVSKDSLYHKIKEHALWNSAAYDKILDEAKMHKIVMINENHFTPQHRVFLQTLLPELKRLGFNYLAVEALFSDSTLNTPKGIPTLKNGFYIREQNFGQLIRIAKKLGFKFVAYDFFTNPQDRETAQAENIYNKTFKMDKRARVIVYAGIAHIFEKPTRNQKKWMAQIFKEKYHMDPLTISQTHLNRYRKLFNQSIGLVNAKVFKNPNMNNVDYLLINNLEINPVQEDDYNFSFQNKFSRPLQLNIFLTSEMKHLDDFKDKIPFKAYYLESGDQLQIKLPEDDYYLVIFDDEGNIVAKEKISTTH